MLCQNCVALLRAPSVVCEVVIWRIESRTGVVTRKKLSCPNCGWKKIVDTEEKNPNYVKELLNP